MAQRPTTIGFFDHHAPNWDARQKHRDAPVISSLIARIGINPGDHVLDVGAGTGVLVPFLEAFEPGRMVAVDISQRMVELYREKHPHHESIIGDAENRLFDDETFHRVIIFNTFPHFQTPEAVFARAFAVLKRQGTLTIAHSMNRVALNEHHRQSGIEVEDDILMPDIDFLNHYEQAGFIDIVVENTTSFFSQGRKP